MAFSVIAKEIGHKFGSLGGPWFRCMYLWILYAFFSEWWNNLLQTQVSTVAAGCFLVAFAYPFVTNSLKNVKYLNLLDIGYVRRFSEILSKLSFPPVLWRYVWDPLTNGLKYTVSFLLGTALTQMQLWCLRGLAAVLLFVIVSLCSQNSNSQVTGDNSTSKRRKIPPPVPNRPPSTRIQAVQARQKMRPHSSNGK